jgi:hypothetical protein
VTDRPETATSLRPRRAGWPSAGAIAVWIGFAIVLAGVALVEASRFEVPEIPATRIVRKDVSAWMTSNGQVEPGEHEVVEGLSEGDLVPLPRDMALRDGIAVRSFIR